MNVKQQISNVIDVVTDFKPGICFRDISGLLANPDLFESAINMMIDLVKNFDFDFIAGLDARGFLFTQVATRLKKGFIMIRKAGKLPNSTSEDYTTEYSKDTFCIQENVLPKGSKVLVIDDLLATGGSFLAACRCIDKIGCISVGGLFLIELTEVENQLDLSSIHVFSLLKFLCNSESKLVEDSIEKETKIVEYLPFDSLHEEDNRTIIFYHPSMEELAVKIIETNSNFRKGLISWGHFPDGTPNIKFEDSKFLENKHVVYIGSTDIPTFFEQTSFASILPCQSIKSLEIILPFYGVGTMERVDKEGDLASAETFANIFSCALPTTQTGAAKLRIFDIHSVVERFYFNKQNVTVCLDSAIELLKNKINRDVHTIVFCDDGSCKRFKNDFPDYRMIVCSKIREGDKRVIKITDRINWPIDETEAMQNLVIVDDLVQSGGTLEECRKALKIAGAGKISAFVTHAVFPNESYKKFFNDNFEKFYITDSNPIISNKLDGKGPFEVLSLSDIISSKLKMINPSYFKGKTLNIYVASLNESKLKASYDGVRRMLDEKNQVHKININVFGMETDSGVSNQPIGDEGVLGCSNRLQNLCEKIMCTNARPDYIISIENSVKQIGIDFEKETYDYCNIEIVNCLENCSKTSKTGSPVKIPNKYYDMSIESKQTLSCGHFIEKEFGYKQGFWHEHFGTKETRCGLMTELISETLNEQYNDSLSYSGGNKILHFDNGISISVDHL